METFHIAILETDSAPKRILDANGSYGEIIDTALRRGHAHVGQPVERLEITTWEVIHAQSYPAVESVDAIFLTAGQHDADQDDPWVPRLLDFVRRVYDAKKPVMGLCYGHQIIARALGGKVSRNPGGWEITIKEVRLSDQGKELFGTEAVKLYQMHRDAVVQAPPGMDVIGWTDACDVQILYQRERVLTLQGHPEFDRLMCMEMLDERLVKGILSSELYHEASLKADGPHDGGLFWRRVWVFLLGDRLMGDARS